MNHIALREHDLVSRLANIDVDFFALYVEEVNRAAAQGEFVEFNELYNEVSTRFLEELTTRRPAMKDEHRFRSEQSDVWDALETHRLTYSMDRKPPSLRGGGFSCMT